MLQSTGQQEAKSAVRKLRPKARLPEAGELRTLTAEDKRTLEWRLSETAECVFHPWFQLPETEATVLAPLPDGPEPVRSRRRPGNDDSGVHILADHNGRSLTADQEKHLFMRFNYARFRVLAILRAVGSKRLSSEQCCDLLHWERLSQETRAEIVRSNVPLVLAMAKRTRINSVDFSDLISEGNLALLRSVEKFDFSRGFKFSTYACRAILKSFSRLASRAARYRGYFPTEFDPTLEKGDVAEKKRKDLEGDCVDELKSILGRNLAKLNDVEQQVIKARFALDHEEHACEPKPKTLEQVGELIGVTKERVRQIQNKALGKLKSILEDSVLPK